MGRDDSEKEPPAKRQKIAAASQDSESDADVEHEFAASRTDIAQYEAEHKERAISPPPVIRGKGVLEPPKKTFRWMASPIQLTRIRDLPSTSNIDTISLTDILGDPMIKENWQFNYLHDIDFIMSNLDEDVRDNVLTTVIHGSWKREDPHRISLEDAAKRWPNVKLITAHMPGMFGTHHSKMMILLRHDDCAQIVIHTANMIQQDWRNLSQAIWRSPLLPLAVEGASQINTDTSIGSGERFKRDLMAYLGAYEGRLRSLVEKLHHYDFSTVRAALVASTPNVKQPASTSSSTTWGWPGLQHILQSIPQRQNAQAKPRVHMQVSSVGTMTEKWINAFFGVLGTTSTVLETSTPPITTTKPVVRLIFPTDDEVRRSLDGYASGSSIHMKLSSKAQQKQYEILKPMLCQWAGDERTGKEAEKLHEAGRRRAAPHIKTFIRFSDTECMDIDWAMVTSANLSKQAWGEQKNKEDKVSIASYEIGVLVWPSLFVDGDEKVVMRPTFKTDYPDVSNVEEVVKVIGFRMPYDLPVAKYGENDVPWCAEQPHLEPDWQGVVWPGYRSTV